MGFFSVYTGAIYNDIFSISSNVFGSRWEINHNASVLSENPILELDPKFNTLESTYPFGLDPAWKLASQNKIIFENAYKMKISIIFGVIHMLFGVVLSLVNYCLLNDPISVLTMFIPQILFLIFLFFYLASLIIVKWILYSGKYYGLKSEACAPQILITFINMVLFKSPAVTNECSPYMFENQKSIQKLLVFCAMICVPWMLLARPILILIARRVNSVYMDGILQLIY